ncbi:MAG TPA: tetratricopeptide repeat protein [Polyangia bacterium]|nr:tetratricopeptide repeat protein [Polyangia bacterium]
MSRPAAAGDEAAQAHYKKARSLYNVSEYRAALDEFKQAYVEHEDPAFLYNIAQCHRQLGDYPEAITFYKRFLSESPKAPNRKDVQRLIAELEGKIGAPAKPPAPVASAPAVEAPAPPPVVEAPPPPPAVVEAPVRRAGLHLELGLGGGGFHDDFTWLNLTKGTASGASGALQLAVTIGVLPHLALGVLGAVESVSSPSVKTGNTTNNDVQLGALGFLGVVADWRLHPGPTGWHFEGALGGARMSIKDPAISSTIAPVGGGIALAGGYDWALGASWQWGLLARAIAVSLSDQGYTHDVQTLSALVFASWH